MVNRAQISKLLAALLAVGLVAAVPGVARADWSPPGISSAQIDLADDGYPPTSYGFGGGSTDVRGRNFTPLNLAQVFQCVEGAADLRSECFPLGAAPTDGSGNFTVAKVAMLVTFTTSGAPGSFKTCAGSNGGTQCEIVAATFDPVTQQPTAKASHYVCFQGAPCKPKPPSDPTPSPVNSAHGERLSLSKDRDLGANGEVIQVGGTGFVPSAVAQIFNCPALTYNLRDACRAVAAAATDSSGAFAPVPVAIDNLLPNCAGYGQLQCSVVGATFAAPTDTDPTSRAEHLFCVTGGYPCVAGDPTIPTTTTIPPEWQATASMSVGRQAPAAAVSGDGRIFVFGGTGIGGQVLDSAESMDPCGSKAWTPITPMPTARTDFAAAAGPDGRIYVIGGAGADGVPLASVDAYDPVAKTWAPVASLAAPRRSLAAVTAPDGRIYAIGGLLGSSTGAGPESGAAVPTVEAYDLVSNSWRPLPPLTYARYGPGAAVADDGRVYVVGGGDSLSTGATGNPPVEYYTPGPANAPGVWQSRRMSRTAPPRAAITGGPDGHIYVIGGGGFTTEVRGSVLTYNPIGDYSTNLTEALTSHRTVAAAAGSRDGRVYAIGGLESTDDLNGLQPLASTEALQVAPNACPRLTQPADFDGNGTTDYSVFRPANGTWFVKDGASTGYGADGDLPIAADYDGDHKTDLAIFRPATGLWAIHRSSDNADTFVTYGISTDVPIPADYDGDERADIAVYRPEFATWWVHRSSDNLDVPTTFGIATDVPVPADYDGDGRADLAVFRDGTWFTLPSSGGAYIATNYGRPGDIPVPADYDADHSIDRAVFRPATGEWFLHHSSDGTDENFAFGVGGDVPVPGDYNGDRIADPAVYRDGQWFVETGETASWGIGTDIPLAVPYSIRRAYFGG